MRSRRLAPIAALAVLAGMAVASAAPLNVTGTWQPKYWTLKMSLQQEGDRVSGMPRS
jgi:hypothetical protein